MLIKCEIAQPARRGEAWSSGYLNLAAVVALVVRDDDRIDCITGTGHVTIRPPAGQSADTWAERAVRAMNQR